MEWIAANIGNIVVVLILSVNVILSVKKIVRDRKKGVNSCGMNCRGCTGNCIYRDNPD